MKNNTMLNFLKIIKLSEEITFLKSQERPIVSKLVNNIGYYNNNNSISEIQKCCNHKDLADYMRLQSLVKYKYKYKDKYDFEILKKDIITLWTYNEIPKLISKRKTTINNIFWRISKDDDAIVKCHHCLDGFMFTAIWIGDPFVYISDTNTVIYGKSIKQFLKKWHNFS